MSIENLPGVHWNAKAAACDAMDRCGNADTFIAVWIDEDGGLRWSRHITNHANLALCALLIQEFANEKVKAMLEP